MNRGGYSAFTKLKEKNTISRAGIGSNDSDICVALIRDGRFSIDQIMLAGCYNLLNFHALDELFPLCKERNIKLYIAAPYCGGILSGNSQNTYYKYSPANEQIIKNVAKIRMICNSFGIDIAHAAMQFVHSHPEVAGVVVGARTVKELEKSIHYANEPLPAAFWLALKQAELIPLATPLTTTPPSSRFFIIAYASGYP